MRNSSTVAKSSLEVSQRAAVDGRITKVIAALGLTFLPNSFTSVSAHAQDGEMLAAF